MPPSPSQPRRRPAPPPPPSPWEDRLLDGADRLLGAALGPPPDPKAGGRPRGPARLFSGSWKRASAAEAVGAALLLLLVVIARPAADEDAGFADAAADTFDGVATGVAADGAVVLASGARVHLLGVTLPTAEDPPVVRAAAFEMLDRLVRGRRVQVGFDPVLPSHLQEGQPMTVAYLWVIDEAGRRQVMANTALLARGLGRPVTALGYAEQGAFVEATYAAQGRGAGLWRQPPPAELPVGPGPVAAGYPPAF